MKIVYLFLFSLLCVQLQASVNSNAETNVLQLEDLSSCFEFAIDFDTPNCGEFCASIIQTDCQNGYGFVDASVDILVDNQTLSMDFGDQPECISLTVFQTYSVTVNMSFYDAYGNETNLSETMDYTMPSVENTTAGFNIIDKQGDEEDLFCVGDDVLFENDGSENETGWYIQICQRNIGDPTENYPCINWTSNKINNVDWQQGQVPSQLNLLTDVWQFHHSQWEFWQGYQYTVTLATNHLPCVQWVADSHTFTVVGGCYVENNGFFELYESGCQLFAVPNDATVPSCVNDITYCIYFGDGNQWCNNGWDWTTHTYSQIGTYNVCLLAAAYPENGGQCVQMKCQEIEITCAQQGFGELSANEDVQYNQQTLSLFPNPTTDFIYFDFESDKWGQDKNLRIFNIQGKIIHQVKLTNEERLDIAHLENGMYIIQLEDQSGNFATDSFVKQ